VIRYAKLENMAFPHVLVISNHFEAKRHSPYTGIFVDRQIASLKKAGIRVSTFDIGTSHSPIHIISKWLKLRRQVRQVNPDLVHGQYGTVVGLLSAFAGRPAVVSFCGNDLQGGHAASVLRMYGGFVLSNLAALRARKLICKSQGLREALWWRREDTVVIPSGIDLDLFSPGAREAAREQLAWDQENQVVLFNAGDDSKVKGLNLAHESMRIVQKRLPKAQLCVTSSVQPDVMPVYYRAADVLLSASLSEGSPNVVKEALACNLPVVSTPVGDVEERLAGVYPSAVVPRDPEAIAEALVQILCERKRSNGREHVMHLDQDQVAQRVLAVYQSVLMSRH
jgi:glycosyltransferase involved in cell wall biosynthesis